MGRNKKPDSGASGIEKTDSDGARNKPGATATAGNKPGATATAGNKPGATATPPEDMVENQAPQPEAVNLFALEAPPETKKKTNSKHIEKKVVGGIVAATYSFLGFLLGPHWELDKGEVELIADPATEWLKDLKPDTLKKLKKYSYPVQTIAAIAIVTYPKMDDQIRISQEKRKLKNADSGINNGVESERSFKHKSETNSDNKLHDEHAIDTAVFDPIIQANSGKIR